MGQEIPAIDNMRASRPRARISNVDRIPAASMQVANAIPAPSAIMPATGLGAKAVSATTPTMAQPPTKAQLAILRPTCRTNPRSWLSIFCLSGAAVQDDWWDGSVLEESPPGPSPSPARASLAQGLACHPRCAPALMLGRRCGPAGGDSHDWGGCTFVTRTVNGFPSSPGGVHFIDRTVETANLQAGKRLPERSERQGARVWRAEARASASGEARAACCVFFPWAPGCRPQVRTESA